MGEGQKPTFLSYPKRLLPYLWSKAAQTCHQFPRPLPPPLPPLPCEFATPLLRIGSEFHRSASYHLRNEYKHVIMIEGERGECEGERGVPFWCKRDRDNFREGLSCFLCLPESRTGDRTEPSRCSIDRLKRTQLPAHVIGNQPNDLKNIIKKRERERERERENESEWEGRSFFDSFSALFYVGLAPSTAVAG